MEKGKKHIHDSLLKMSEAKKGKMVSEKIHFMEKHILKKQERK